MLGSLTPMPIRSKYAFATFYQSTAAFGTEVTRLVAIIPNKSDRAFLTAMIPGADGLRLSVQRDLPFDWKDVLQAIGSVLGKPWLSVCPL